MAVNTEVFVALDMTDIPTARAQARALAAVGFGFKLGLEFFCANGAAGVRATGLEMGRLFLDLKLHDIPNTVAGAVRALAPLAPKLLTVHLGGGEAMAKAAVAAARAASTEAGRPMRLVGVTVLTSMADEDLAAVGQQGPVAEQVRRLAALAQRCGLDGVVCSPHEIAALRRDCGTDFLLVVPGIRPSWAGAGDQKRTMTPRDAAALGASCLVIGRPITAAADPPEAARRIAEEIALARPSAA